MGEITPTVKYRPRPADSRPGDVVPLPNHPPPLCRAGVLPPGFKVKPQEAQRIAGNVPKVREALAEHPRARAYVQLPLYGYYIGNYAVTYIDTQQDEIVADVYVNAATGDVFEAYTGPAAGTFLARGLKPSVGNSLNEPYIWIALALLFMAPFVDPRRPFRLVHLDLLVLLSFGISQLYFNAGNIDVSVPLVYPPLLYLLGRLLFAGFRPRERREPLIPYAKASWLWVGLALLIAFRIGLNVVDSRVIDVGYASAVGADRIMSGAELYVFNSIHGDTYGPFNYLSYVPFVALFSWDGSWDAVVPAHAASITFDLLAIGGLLLLGRRLRSGEQGRLLGLGLAWAFAACPWSILVLQTNTNDSLVAALLVGALLAISSPAGRGLMIGLGTAAKFAPLALAPLFATGLGTERRLRSWTVFGAVLIATCLGLVVVFLPDGGWREFYDTTIGFQLGRYSPLSVWGLHESLDWLQSLVKLGAVALAIAVAFVPRRRDLRQVAALAAAVLIAAQLVATYWFYLYLAWILPPVLVAIFAAYRDPAPATEPSADLEPAVYAAANGSRAPVPVAAEHP
jgi:Glycosyltransferase family 87